MKRLSLTARLALLLATFSFVTLVLLGGALYVALARQLALRDDGALLARVEQIRTLLRDLDARQLIDEKPQLFANMLGNTESLLVIRYAGATPLLVVNPGQRPIPDVTPLPADQPLALGDVRRSVMADGSLFIYTAVTSEARGGRPPLEILSGRLLSERTRILGEYRDNIVLFASVMAVLAAVLAYLLAKRGMSPLHRLARQTASIGVGTLSLRLERDRAPAELDALIVQFNAMLERLERGFEQLKQVSADMAHDLRTPINNLLGQTEVGLGLPRDSAYYQHLLGSNFEELQRLSRMIDNMLFLARAEHADHAIERTGLAVAQELARICEYFEDLAAERDVHLAWNGQGTVWADATLLRRALANLLSNAVRFAEPGSTVEVTARSEANGVVVDISNRGLAIAPHHLQSVFERFYRVDAARQGSAQSSGLGLSIVRSIMQLHQGRCWAQSADGVTRFSLWFPSQNI
ncbi:heavy metal sensor histidine kinase [Pseudomonas entomophila]|uniref:heavy metal sensor histidine kinase n=1 Tax=Pseudomonas entomophila TaxID=312306 RepID=UPI0023D80333|nr:heavy metal sensor histidine kinase [Pseudomonas entomophila]MDF0732920.1 heavy metal sensor histidine kinase [Pseudomonas entomophila]